MAHECAADGFVRGHLAKREGFWVRRVDRKFSEYAVTEADGFVIGDLCYQLMVQDVIDRRFDGVFQLAVDVGGDGCISTGENNADIMHSSVPVDRKVTCACDKRNVKRDFHSSPACMYPEYSRLNPENSDYVEDSSYAWYRVHVETGRATA